VPWKTISWSPLSRFLARLGWSADHFGSTPSVLNRKPPRDDWRIRYHSNAGLADEYKSGESVKRQRDFSTGEGEEVGAIGVAT
jgi:hypothetical protein